MTTDNSTARAEWDTRLARFEALRLMVETDEQLGRLGIANADARFARDQLRRTPNSPEIQQAARFAGEHEQCELERHLAQFWHPALDAALAVMRTPAPDIGAARLKLEIATGAMEVDAYMEDGEPFRLIAEDVQRLSPA